MADMVNIPRNAPENFTTNKADFIDDDRMEENREIFKEDHKKQHGPKLGLKQLAKEYKDVDYRTHNQAVVSVARALKNRRRSRNGFGQGLPKKGGAGGKGVWGTPGSELDAPQVLDKKDPNYDSDSAEMKDTMLKAVVPKLSDEELQKQVELIILEYFEHGVTGEVVVALNEFNFAGRRHLVVVWAVEQAMDHKPSTREMTSVLISDLYEHFLTEEDIEKGMDILLKNLPDLVLDTPDAPAWLGNFIARAIADDCLAPKFLQKYQGKVEEELAKQALARADVLISMKHGMARLDNVWGVGGGLRPVTTLVKSMGLLLQEYLSSGDTAEAARCLQDLEVPHFHHELVYEAILMAIEASNEETENAIVKLLREFAHSTVLTIDQLKNGFQRIIDDLDDICLDVPNAVSILERIANKCRAEHLISEELLHVITSRPRKRLSSQSAQEFSGAA